MEQNKVRFSALQLQAMPESTFSSLFHSANWSQLTNDTKLAMCQELENRLAVMDNVNPRTVVPEQMQGACYGYQQGQKIAINLDMLNDGVFRTTYIDGNGNSVTREHAVQAASWNVYDTVVHEHTHGVSLDRDQAPYTYITSDSDHNLYRIQGEEKGAYAAGQNATLEAIGRAEAAMGRPEPEKAAYLQSINAESFEQSLKNAQLAYNDPMIEKTLAQFISDQDNGIVPANPSASYVRLQTLYQAQVTRELQELGWEKTIPELAETGEHAATQDTVLLDGKVQTLQEDGYDGALDESEETAFDNILEIGPDGGIDNGPDGGMDDGPDGGMDDGPDGGMDDGPDGGIDNSPDGGMDDGPDGGIDDHFGGGYDGGIGIG